ncbi:MAG TPA: LytTR family DNA-binding domain-containing protein [Bacteroidales bacterium]|nr:LytTR family DNA-binding domain-containing protein [Bacteroidales bacterium]
MNVLIIEDESIAAERLASNLRDIEPEARIVGFIDSVKDAVKWFSNNSADLVFLDIQLSDGISFSIFEQVDVDTPVIFTTAYDEYAIKAFRLNSIDYLLKPIRKSDLMESMRKFHKVKSANHVDFDKLLNALNQKTPDYKQRFLLQYGERMVKVDVTDIAYFYVLEKSVFLKTESGNSYPVNHSLDKLVNMLNPALFFRINRKMIVNIDAIKKMTAYSRGRVKLSLNPSAENEQDAVVSVERANGFKNWLNG